MLYYLIIAYIYICGAQQNLICHFLIYLRITTHLSIFSKCKELKREKTTKDRDFATGPWTSKELSRNTWAMQQCSTIYLKSRSLHWEPWRIFLIIFLPSPLLSLTKRAGEQLGGANSVPPPATLAARGSAGLAQDRVLPWGANRGRRGPVTP